MSMSLPQLAGSNSLTHSRMSCYKTCPKKHYFSYELGIRPERSPDFFTFGSAFHLGLDLRAQGKSIDDAILGATAGYGTLPNWCQSDEQIHAWKVARETVAALLAGYFWYWERPEIPDALRPTKVIATEQAFTMPIRNPDTGASARNFVAAGKCDKIVELGDGRLAVMEHKTTGDDISPTSDYWKRLKIDQQISLYYMAARDRGYNVETVLYDVVRKPGIAPKPIPVLDEQGFKIVLDPSGQRAYNDNKTGDVDYQRQPATKEKRSSLRTQLQTPNC